MMGETDRSPADVDLVELLDEANAGVSGSPAHDVVATTMATVAAGSTGSGRFVFELGDNLATVTAWVREFTGRPLGQGATWVRFRDPARGTGLLAVIHSPLSLTDGGGEADLILAGHRGMLARVILRDLCAWAFYGIGLSRLVVRIPVSDTDLIELTRRGGFEWEGRARDFYGPGLDASVWAMTGASCRWLPSASPATTNPVPPINLRIH